MNTTEEIPRFGHVASAFVTDVGRKRRNNEDNCGTYPEQGVFCVADGMGGARDGEVASRIAVEHVAAAVSQWHRISPPMALEDRLALLDKALNDASAWINGYADSHDAHGCGTTFVGMALDPGDPSKAVAMHAGDSRLYRIRRRRITQITNDHSVANMAGVKNEAELDPAFRNMILRAVGIKPTVELERTPFDVSDGDWIIVCSDGLSKMVDDKSIMKIVDASEDPASCAQALVDEANRRGGKDNVTVVCVHIGTFSKALPVHQRLSAAELESLVSGAAAAPEGQSTISDFTMPTTVTDGGSATEAADGWMGADSDEIDVPNAAGEEKASDKAIAEATTDDIPSEAGANGVDSAGDKEPQAKVASEASAKVGVADAGTTIEDGHAADATCATTAHGAHSSSAPSVRVVRKRRKTPYLISAAIAFIAVIGALGLGIAKSRPPSRQKLDMAAAGETLASEMRMQESVAANLCKVIEQADELADCCGKAESIKGAMAVALATAAETAGVADGAVYRDASAKRDEIAKALDGAIASRQKQLDIVVAKEKLGMTMANLKVEANALCDAIAKADDLKDVRGKANAVKDAMDAALAAAARTDGVADGEAYGKACAKRDGIVESLDSALVSRETELVEIAAAEVKRKAEAELRDAMAKQEAGAKSLHEAIAKQETAAASLLGEIAKADDLTSSRKQAATIKDAMNSALDTAAQTTGVVEGKAYGEAAAKRDEIAGLLDGAIASRETELGNKNAIAKAEQALVEAMRTQEAAANTLRTAIANANDLTGSIKQATTIKYAMKSALDTAAQTAGVSERETYRNAVAKQDGLAKTMDDAIASRKRELESIAETKKALDEAMAKQKAAAASLLGAIAKADDLTESRKQATTIKNAMKSALDMAAKTVGVVNGAAYREASAKRDEIAKTLDDAIAKRQNELPPIGEPIRVRFEKVVPSSDLNILRAKIGDEDVSVSSGPMLATLKRPLPETVKFRGTCSGLGDVEIDVPLASLVANSKDAPPVVYLAPIGFVEAESKSPIRHLRRRAADVADGGELDARAMRNILKETRMARGIMAAANSLYRDKFAEELKVFRWACEYLIASESLSEEEKTEVRQWLKEVAQ
ncbi:MAG: protein phosphatase 2C domain-containing protein [Kiritimatiellae bacterium]|nr:protein phosphatase 2C domain-containing protein [Kiritimatiellia bacterium]